MSRLKFALRKKSLDQLVADLEAWQNRFDPTWYLVIRMSGNPVIDSALTKSKQQQTSLNQNLDPLNNVRALRSALEHGTITGNYDSQQKFSRNLAPAALKDAKRTIIPFSTARAIDAIVSNELLIVEPVDRPLGSFTPVKVDVENLVRKLQQVDPGTFSLLRCYGLLKHVDPITNGLEGLEVVYRAPSGSEPPSTLRQLLLEQPSVSLSAVIRVARQLIQSVSYIHACDFVHKNIRPENILVFSNNESSLGSSFLLGFNQFRNANFQTNMIGDPAWHRNLYRHPQRQGASVQERYVMQHDIYSLGVCLLEIGLWRSFVWYPGISDSVAAVPPHSLGLTISDKDFEVIRLNKTSLRVKKHLVHLAKSELPSRVGDLYTEAVRVLHV